MLSSCDTVTTTAKWLRSHSGSNRCEVQILVQALSSLQEGCNSFWEWDGGAGRQDGEIFLWERDLHSPQGNPYLGL